jgi:hypothetical protein
LVATHAGRPRIYLHLVARVGATLQSSEADGPAPAFASSSHAAAWAGYLGSWWDAQPAGLAADLVDAVDYRRARLYPSLSGNAVTGEWSLRIDGLQVGAVGSAGGHLGIGRAGTRSGVAVTAWKKVAGTGQKVVSALPGDGELGVAAAARLVRALIGEFDDAAGGRLEHGQPEHALEATVLRGELKVMVGGRALEPLVAPSDPPGSPARSRVARGSQVPAQWWPGGVGDLALHPDRLLVAQPRRMLLLDHHPPGHPARLIHVSQTAGSHHRRLHRPLERPSPPIRLDQGR